VVVLIVALVLLVATNLITLALLVRWTPRDGTGGDTVEVFEAPRPAGMRGSDRRLITVELLNPMELAVARGGRIASLAGTVAPGWTRRLVYEQTLRILRRELHEQDVLADVRLHSVRAVPRRDVPSPRRPGVVEATVVDQVAPLDLGDPPTR
jgi:hypothetical protein